MNQNVDWSEAFFDVVDPVRTSRSGPPCKTWELMGLIYTQSLGSFWNDTGTVITSSQVGLPECTNGGVFVGSIAHHMGQRASMGEPFLTFPIDAVRRWARGEIMFVEQNAENFTLTEEELF